VGGGELGFGVLVVVIFVCSMVACVLRSYGVLYGSGCVTCFCFCFWLFWAAGSLLPRSGSQAGYVRWIVSLSHGSRVLVFGPGFMG